MIFFFFSSRRRHTRLVSDWSSDVCSSDLGGRDRVREQRQSKEARGHGIHFLLLERRRGIHGGEEGRQAAERRGTEKGKREDPETDRGAAKAQDQKGSQRRKGQGRREERREG